MPTRNRSAFTLIEVLAVVTIIAVLMAILLPALRSVRQQSSNMTSLSMMRELSGALIAYSNQYDLYYPFFGKTTVVIGQTRIPPPPGHTIHPAVLGATAEVWASAVIPHLGAIPTVGGEPIMWRDEDQPPPDGLEWDVYVCRYYMTCTAFAGPRYWNTHGDFNTADIHGMRATQVRYPSQKGALLDTFFDDMLNPQQGTVRIAFADGSVRTETWQTESNIHPFPSPPLFDYRQLPIMATEDGFEGRDYD